MENLGFSLSPITMPPPSEGLKGTENANTRGPKAHEHLRITAYVSIATKAQSSPPPTPHSLIARWKVRRTTKP